MLAALNDLGVFASNIGNEYLNAPYREKIWKKHGPYFGSQQGCGMLIVKALYDLKSRGASLRAVLVETLFKDSIGYTSTDTDKDVWIKRELLPCRKEYYSMVLVYVDYILCIHKDTSVVIYALVIICVMKQGSMVPPYRYLGANIDKVQTQYGKFIWATHSGDYCKAEIANIEKTLTDNGKSLFQDGYGMHPYLPSVHP